MFPGSCRIIASTGPRNDSLTLEAVMLLAAGMQSPQHHSAGLHHAVRRYPVSKIRKLKRFPVITLGH